ncbi:MAG: hypothetical protein NC087_09995 [Anaeroplasma bactoclasticum]|nr:hypothetical protein [Anaeroplasma bactoclasticum]MCM1557838.1 hypothetical protein [Anaeroplasma bactoclasticum]
MVHLYEVLIRQNYKILFKDYQILMNSVYEFLIEYDKFKNDNYHKVFHYSYMRKIKHSQANIGKDLGMDQSTISRKSNEIRKFITLKINEVK